MAKIGSNTFRNWNDNDTINAADYKQERELIRVALNDADDKASANGTEVTGLKSRMDQAEADIDALELNKANAADVYTKSQVYTKDEIDPLWDDYSVLIGTRYRKRFMFVAEEGQTLFNLPEGVSYIVGKDLLDVVIGTVPQYVGNGITETSETSFTVTEPLPAGTKVYVTVWGVNAGVGETGYTLDDLKYSKATYSWEAEEGQTQFVLPDGVTYNYNANQTELVIEGAQQELGYAYEENIDGRTITTAAPVEAGLRVVLKYITGAVVNPAQSHSANHYVGGSDPLDVTKLLNYQSEVSDKIGILSQKSDWVSVKEYEHLVTGTDWTAAIQRAVDDVIPTGGTVYFPKGTYRISSTIIANTSNKGKKLTIRGAGLGATLIITTTDVDAFKLNGFLIKMCDMELSGMTGTTKSGILVSETGSCGRFEFEYVQAKNFKNGFTHLCTFDQVWIHKCFFSSNTQYGIYFNQAVSGGGALLDITHSITNWNGSHGVHITNTNIYGHITLRHHESVANVGRGISIVGGGTYSMLGVTLEQMDIEYVKSTADSGLYMQNVRKFNIIGGQVNVDTGHTINAAIHLDNCRSGIIMNPWLRNTGDGFGTQTHYIYASNGTKDIYLFGANYFGTPIDFTVDSATDKSLLMNMDTITSNHKKLFFPAASFNSSQGTPTLSSVSGINSWLFSHSAVDNINPAVALSLFNKGKIKKMRLYWFNSGTGSGAVSFQVGYKKVNSGSSISATRTYDSLVRTASAQNSLVISDITPSDTNLVGDFVSLWVIRNIADVNDTLDNQVGIIGIEIDVE